MCCDAHNHTVYFFCLPCLEPSLDQELSFCVGLETWNLDINNSSQIVGQPIPQYCEKLIGHESQMSLILYIKILV